MTQINWQTPPPKRRRRTYTYDWEPFVAALKAHPGEWAVFDKEVSAATGWLVRRGKHTAFQGGTFETVMRKGKKEHLLYARYMGEGTGDAQ
ncbi:MAG: hypothetical protein KIC38_03755 [Actinomycetaceae bacterium]|nr:hypothetical protein [Actinomycetaceae bacterium]